MLFSKILRSKGSLLFQSPAAQARADLESCLYGTGHLHSLSWGRIEIAISPHQIDVRNLYVNPGLVKQGISSVVIDVLQKYATEKRKSIELLSVKDALIPACKRRGFVETSGPFSDLRWTPTYN